MCLVLTKADSHIFFTLFPSTPSVSIVEQLPGIGTVLGSGEQVPALQEHPAGVTGRGCHTAAQGALRQQWETTQELGTIGGGRGGCVESQIITMLSEI